MDGRRDEGKVGRSMVRTLRKIVPTLRILGYLRTRTGVRIYAVLEAPFNLA